MGNSIALFEKYINKLDEVYAMEAKTAVLDGNNELVRAGSNTHTIQVPKMTMDGLADYSRTSGYVLGDVSIEYEDVAFNYDRGRKFSVDIMDDDPNTKSYEDFLPPRYEIDTDMENWLKDVFKQRKNKYRRYRDLSIFAFAGMYIVAAIDAYVDAELSHFDISRDLSLRVQPNILLDHRGAPSAGFSLALNF